MDRCPGVSSGERCGGDTGKRSSRPGSPRAASASASASACRSGCGPATARPGRCPAPAAATPPLTASTPARPRTPAPVRWRHAGWPRSLAQVSGSAAASRTCSFQRQSRTAARPRPGRATHSALPGNWQAGVRSAGQDDSIAVYRGGVGGDDEGLDYLADLTLSGLSECHGIGSQSFTVTLTAGTERESGPGAGPRLRFPSASGIAGQAPPSVRLKDLLKRTDGGTTTGPLPISLS